MTTNVKKYVVAGIDQAWIALTNSSGYPAGISGTIANGADGGMHDFDGVQSLNLQTPAAPVVNVPGDDGNLATFRFAPTEAAQGDNALGTVDADVIANALGGKVYSDGDWEWITDQPEEFTYQDIWLVTNSQAKSRAAGSVGNAGYEVRIYKIQLQPQAGNLETAGASNQQYQVTAQMYDMLPWGDTLSSANQGTPRAFGPYRTYAENRITLHTLIGDGATNTVALDKEAAADTGAKVRVFNNGTELDYNASPAVATDYSVSTTAGTTTVTIGTAGSAVADGDVIIVVYEYVQ